MVSIVWKPKRCDRKQKRKHWLQGPFLLSNWQCRSLLSLTFGGNAIWWLPRIRSFARSYFQLEIQHTLKLNNLVPGDSGGTFIQLSVFLEWAPTFASDMPKNSLALHRFLWMVRTAPPCRPLYCCVQPIPQNECGSYHTSQHLTCFRFAYLPEGGCGNTEY